jgi:hypothetical protein
MLKRKRFVVGTKLSKHKDIRRYAADAKAAVLSVRKGIGREWRVDSVEDEETGESFEVLGSCESCGTPIFDREPYGVDLESSVYICHQCVAKERKATKRGSRSKPAAKKVSKSL